MYKIALPSVIGREGAGIVEAVGTNVTSCQVGDRVAYASSPMGAYAEARLMPADRIVKIPAAISDQQAASMMLKGMTAQYLLRRTYRVKAGDIILSHAAAGGVGLILGQWAKHLGATVIGTVGSEEKMALAKANGCDHVINYRTEDFQARVMEITNGKKCQVVYDGVGQDTWAKSLDCIAPLGMMVSFGAASGAVKPFYIGELAAKGSLYLTRPTLDTYTATRADLAATADELFAVVASGAVAIEVNQTYALRDAAQAHRDLEARKTTGSTVLIP
jgi:NADPH2:quinone reductase